MQTRPYGTWTSPISSQRVAAGSLRLSQTRWHRGDVYWLEGRPAEGGRQVVMRAREGGGVDEVTSAEFNVRTLVHEYGGGDYSLRDGRLVFAHFADQRVYRQDAAGGAATALTTTGARHADFDLSPDGRWLVAVEERPRPEAEPENRVVALSLAGGTSRVVAEGCDFYAAPRFSPEGSRLAFVAWNHPAMPWDATQLFEIPWDAEGPAAAPRAIAGGLGESVVQPRYSPEGRLTFVSDRSGWWNLYQLRDGRVITLCSRKEEFAHPAWAFGLSSYAFLSEETLLCVVQSGGRDRLVRLDLSGSGLSELPLDYSSIEYLCAEGERVCFVASSPERAGAVCSYELGGDGVRELRKSGELDFDASFVSIPEAIEFPTEDGQSAHAFVYRPRNGDFAAPTGEKPPLLVKSHGGPTGSARSGFDAGVQYWTTRGFAVADVNYRGSTGFGRVYRDLLRGQWGIADVADCVGAARTVAEHGGADSTRLAISGGSAGGFTTLCALTFHDIFRAGASHYGIGDLEALARDTHKFEARYLDGLIGPYPECRDLYRQRSPIHHVAGLSCPVIFFQGLEDKVVPPAQAEAMVKALARRGIPHAYVSFPGEQHGFRRAENMCAALDGELYFYARIFGFEVDVRPDAVRIEGLPGAAGAL